MARKRVYLFVCVIFSFSVNMLLYGHFDSMLNSEGNGKENMLIKVLNSEIYIYSAVAVFIQSTYEAAQKSKQLCKCNAVAVSAFDIDNESLVPFRCCFMLKKGPVVNWISSSKNSYHASAIRRGIQLICPLRHNISDIRSVSLTFKNNKCPIERQYYKEIILPTHPVKRNKQEKTIAVCAKLSYGDLDADRLVEWLEALRLFGVDRVFSHLYMLNPQARNVFKFYEKEGFAETVEFNLPRKDIQSKIDINVRQGWNDEQVALFNCQARLIMYDYVVVLDTDEFLVPKANMFKNGWRKLFDELFQKSEIATFYFWTVLHITTWGPTYPGYSVFIKKYINCTIPMIDREKLVYIPTKVAFGSATTHTNYPFKGFKRNGVDPEKALVHHYRGCRQEWLDIKSTNKSNRNWLEKRTARLMAKKNDSYFFYMKAERYCFDFRRFYSYEIDKLTNIIMENVSRIVSNIHGTKYMYQ